MSTRIRDLIYILKEKPDPAQERREFDEATKENLWSDLKKQRNVVYVLSYACGCAIFAGLFDGFEPFPWLLLQILITMISGAIFGFVVGSIVVTIFHRLGTSLHWMQRLLTFVLVPVILMLFLYVAMK